MTQNLTFLRRAYLYTIFVSYFACFVTIIKTRNLFDILMSNMEIQMKYALIIAKLEMQCLFSGRNTLRQYVVLEFGNTFFVNT
jgi:hypothetical protein